MNTKSTTRHQWIFPTAVRTRRAEPTRDRVMQVLVYCVGLFCAALFVGAKIPWITDSVAKPLDRDGDLFNIARVSAFRETLPPKVTDGSPRRVTDRSKAQIWVFGDSFQRAMSGHAPFADQLADSLDRTIWVGPRYRRKEVVDLAPLPDGKTRWIVIQSIDRFIDLDFAGDLTPSQHAGGRSPWFSTAIEWRSRLFRETERGYRQMIANLPGGREAVNTLADLRYEWLGEISKKTPVQRHDPPMLFYYQNVESGEGLYYKGVSYQHTDAQIENIADRFAALDEALAANNTRVLFVGIPNKYLLYGGVEDQYDQFLPRLQKALTERGVASVELYRRYRQETELVYWPSDTHWNARGVAIAVEAAAKQMRRWEAR